MRGDINTELYSIRLKVQGTLAGSCVKELEGAWLTASAIVGERSVTIDLSEVVSLDGTGRDLILRMRQMGATLLGDPTLGCSVVEFQG